MPHDHNTVSRPALRWFAPATIAFAVASAACTEPTGNVDGAFYRWDQAKVLCAIDIDSRVRVDRASIITGLDRALANREVLQLFAHVPGGTVDVDVLDFTFAAAVERGIPFVTYRQLLDDESPRAGLAFSFDDASIEQWFATRELFDRYRAKVTFFITRYQGFDDSQVAKLKQLAADGHDIEAHSVSHARGPDYVENYGLRAYIDDEVLPSLTRLRADGFDPQVYAYPYGSRTRETDDAILPYVRALRSVAYVRGRPLVDDPCPY
jgi:hypothetical protein